MKYLHQKFDEELDADGEINIANQIFVRHQILCDLAPEAYGIAFNDWLELRQLSLIEKADEIIGLYDNDGRFEQLNVTSKRGSLIPFVGAGMSINSGFPSWAAFLYQLCEESHVTEEEIEALVFRGDYEEAAQLLYDDLGSNLFNANLQETFARNKLPQGPINYLPHLFSGKSVITTNFDLVIEQIYEIESETGFDLIQSGKYLAEAVRQMAGGSRLLIKLHGDCRQNTERVLTRSEYEESYTDDHVIEKLFHKLMFGQSILFLGCSLNQDRTLSLMKQIVQENGADTLPRHYAFLELKDDDDRVARKKDLAEANIFPVWYPENDHDDAIEALFIKLLQD